MDDGYKIQVSYKLGNNQAGMLNIRGQSVAEVDESLSQVRELLLPGLTGLEEELKAVGLIQQAFNNQVTAANNARPAQRPAQAGNGGINTGETPSCVHGPRVYKSGDDWQGWFCPAQKNDPTKCKAQYIR